MATPKVGLFQCTEVMTSTPSQETVNNFATVVPAINDWIALLTVQHYDESGQLIGYSLSTRPRHIVDVRLPLGKSYSLRHADSQEVFHHYSVNVVPRFLVPVVEVFGLLPDAEDDSDSVASANLSV